MKTSILFKAGVLGIMAMLCFSRVDAQDAKFYYGKGADLYGQKQHDLAIANFSRAINLDPNYTDAYIYRGVVYYAKKEYDLAIGDYNKAIGLNSNYGLSYYNRGLAYYAKREDDLAMQDFSKTVSLDPSYTNAYFYRGRVYYGKKEYDLAIWDYNKAIGLNPNDGLSYYNRGLVYYAKKEDDLAMQDFSKTVSLDPTYTNAYFYRGNVYYAKKEDALAIQDYSTVIRLSPNYALSYYYRGLAYHNQNEFNLAIQDYNKAIILNPEYVHGYYSRARTYIAKKEYDLAIQDNNKAISLDPNYTDAYINRGIAYYNKKEYGLAIQDYSTAISLNPNYALGYLNRGLAYYEQKENNLAIQDYNKAISLNPDYTEAYINRGLANDYKKEYDLSIQDYSKAVSLNPNYALSYYNRGITYDAKREYDLAIQDYSKAISLNPNYINAYNNRGLTYNTKGEYNLSVSDFKKAISMDANYARAFINIIEPLARLSRFSEAAGYYNVLREKKLSTYIDNDTWDFFKKYVEAITKDLTINNYTKALSNLYEAEKLYNNKEQKNDNSQKNNFASILALKGYVLEQLSRGDEAKQAYEQTLVINSHQPDVTVALQRFTKKQEVFVQNDETAPTITILEPSAKWAITVEDDKPTGTQRIRGKAIDAGGIKKMTVNNVPVKVEEGGYFETIVNIKEGVNVFTLVVSDNNANTASESIVIETSKEKDKPKPVAVTDIIPVLNNAPTYHAVLIAENDYSDAGIKDLPGTVIDMRTMYRLLVNNYNFAPANTDTLVNATKVTILESLIQKANAMKDNDNLFIFYAGHGQMIRQPDESEEGFLVPADAVKNKRSSYISSNDLTGTIKYSKAKHILFVADACFAGSLFRDMSSEAPITVAEAYKDKSRKLLASGNRQAVPDQSEFMEYFRLALQENRTKYITAEQLIDSFKNEYKTTTRLQLQYYPIKNVDDLGGQFVFIRK